MEESRKVNRTAVKKFKLGEEPKDSEYWLSRPVEERIAEVEYLREQYYGKDEINKGLQRVLRIVKRKKS